MQKFWIQRLLFKEKAALEQSTGNRDGNVDSKKLLSLVVQLRKAANHPFLFPGVEKPTRDGRASEDIVNASGKLIILDRLLEKLYDKGHRVVIFSQVNSAPSAPFNSTVLAQS